MNSSILDTEVQEFIRKNINSDIAKISLSKSPFSGVSPKELAQQIDAKRRCESKLPLWYTTPGIYYPEKLAIEQCSSEITAKYKSRLLAGESVIDLTGGFGVDASFFSKKVGNVTHCEINKELSGISAYNSRVLGLDLNHLHGDGIAYLKESTHSYGTIYIDPSRRVSSRKVFMLQDCEPNVISEKALLLHKCERLIIKTAPLLDLQSTIKELGTVDAIHILSVNNECKEVLYIIDKYSGSTDPPITCVALSQNKTETFTFHASDEGSFEVDGYSKPLSYLYEPDVALLKGGCFKLICREFKVEKLHQHTHLYTSDALCERFIGRKFKVVKTMEYGSFIKTQNFNNANIICRNFPQEPDMIRKKLKINDGGSDYLIFCTGPNNELLVIHCNRLP